MNIQEFLNLPPEHTISFEDGKELHKEIALKGLAGLSNKHAVRLQEYLELCLLHRTVSPALRNKLQTICEDLRGADGRKYES